MEIQAIALDSFAHGAKQYLAGELINVNKDTAEEMRKRGLIAYEDVAPQTGVTDSQDDLEDLVGGDKAEPAPKNKMQPAPANKGKK